MTVPNHYEVLGIDQSASQEEIKRAYRVAMRNNHSDRGGSEQVAVQINLAHDTLRNPLTRKDYDDALKRGVPSEPGSTTTTFTQGTDTATTTPEPPPTAPPSWGQSTNWDGSPQTRRRRTRRAENTRDRTGDRARDRPGPDPGSGDHRPGRHPGAVAPDISAVTWTSAEGPATVSKGRPEFLRQPRRTLWTVGVLAVWALWTALPWVLGLIVGVLAPSTATSTGGSFVFLILMGVPLGGILMSRAGCFGMGVHLLGAFVAMIVVLTTLWGDRSSEDTVIGTWLGVGLILYLVAGQLWAKPGQRLPPAPTIPASDLLQYFFWGRQPFSPVTRNSTLDWASTAVKELIHQLRDRIPGLRYVVRLGSPLPNLPPDTATFVPFAVIVNKRIALVYAVTATNGTVTWGKNREILEQAATGGESVILTGFADVPPQIKRSFPEAKIKTWVVVVPYSGARPKIAPGRAPSGIHLVDQAEFLQSCGAWLVGGKPTVIRQDLVSRLSELSVPLS